MKKPKIPKRFLRMNRFPRFLFLLFFAGLFLGPSGLAIAAGGDALKMSVERATDISKSMSRPGQTCSSATNCSKFFNELIKDDQADGYFFDFHLLGKDNWPVHVGKMLQGRAGICMKGIDPKSNKAVTRFPTATDMQKYLQSQNSELDAETHSAIRSCVSLNGPDDLNKTAKYYYDQKRIQQAQDMAQTEINRIDTLLGQNPACANQSGAATALKDVAQQSEADEKIYQKMKSDATSLSTGCLKDLGALQAHKDEIVQTGQTQICEEANTLSAKTGRSNCQSYDSAALQKVSACEKQQAADLAQMSLLEKANPWFVDTDYFSDRADGMSSQAAIQKVQSKTKDRLQALQSDFTKASQCLQGLRQNCSLKKYRETLAATPELPEIYNKDPLNNAMNSYFSAESCIEEGVSDRDKTDEVLRTSGRDAVLSIASMGTAGIVAKAGEVGVKSLRGTDIVRGLLGVRMLGVSAFNLAESSLKAVKICSQQNEVNLSAAQKESSLTCPDPRLQQVVARKTADSCLREVGLASLNALPFIVPVNRMVRVEADMIARNSQLSDVDRIATFEKMNSVPAGTYANDVEKRTAILAAHSEAGTVKNLNLAQIKSRVSILKSAGFSSNEIRRGMTSGIFGKPMDPYISAEIPLDSTFGNNQVARVALHIEKVEDDGRILVSDGEKTFYLSKKEADSIETSRTSYHLFNNKFLKAGENGEHETVTGDWQAELAKKTAISSKVIAPRESADISSYYKPSLSSSRVVQQPDARAEKQIEVLSYQGQRVEAKISPLSQGRVVPGSADEVYQKELLNESKWAEALDRSSDGPKFLGIYQGKDGQYRIATEHIEGMTIHPDVHDVPVEAGHVPDISFDRMEQMSKKLVESGVDPVDIQFRVTPTGKVYVVDPTHFQTLTATDNKEQILKRLQNEIELMRQAKQKERTATLPSAD